MRRSLSGILLATLLLSLLEGCSAKNGPDSISYNLGHNTGSVGDDRFEKSVVLNQSPRLVIAKPKVRKIEQSGTGFGFGFGKLMGGLQGKDGQDYKTNTSADRGAESRGSTEIFGGAGAHLRAQDQQSGSSGGRYATVQTVEAILPAVAVAWGGEETVVKSVNGGFATLLLREGNQKNIHACHSLFEKLEERTNREIELAADQSNVLSRPTYWFDRRAAPPEINKPVDRSQSASAGSSVQLASTATVQGAVSSRRDPNCTEKLQHYHFEVSNSLIKRLGLFDRPGPFLAAWRDDGAKAMIVDLSMMDSRSDFNMAMEMWKSKIVRNVDAWEKGLLDSQSFQKEISPLLQKSGKSGVSIRKPTPEQPEMN